MSETCLAKQEEVKKLFASCQSKEEIYQKIIDLGRAYQQADQKYATEENRVQGCQSVMYLHSFDDEDRLCFAVISDALISLGLAVLLIKVYSGETPEAILKTPPTYLKEIGVAGSLSPGRAMGLASLFKKMHAEALKRVMAAEKKEK